jgi:hypothetical protein
MGDARGIAERAGGCGDALGLLTRYCALGVRVDVSAHGDGLGFVFGEPDTDAIAVAEAIRALDTEARFADVEDVLPLFEDDIAGIAHEAARMIARSVFDPRSIVISCAVQGTRPKWRFELPTPKQMFAPSIGGAPRAMVYGIDADGDLVEVRARRRWPLSLEASAALAAPLVRAVAAAHRRVPRRVGDVAPCAHVARARSCRRARRFRGVAAGGAAAALGCRRPGAAHPQGPRSCARRDRATPRAQAPGRRQAGRIKDRGGNGREL